MEDFVEAGDVAAVCVAGAVVGVSLDLHRQSRLPEEEVEVAAAAAGEAEFDLGLGAQAGIEHVQAGHRFRGGAGAAVGEAQPVPGAGAAAKRAFECDGERRHGGERRATYAVHGAVVDRRLHGHERVVPGPGAQEVGKGAGHVRDGQPAQLYDVAFGEGHPVDTYAYRAPHDAEPGIGELDVRWLPLVPPASVQDLDPPEPGRRPMTHDEPRLEQMNSLQPHGQIDTPPWLGPGAALDPRPPFRAQPPEERSPRPPRFQGPRGEQHTSLYERPQLRPFHAPTVPETLRPCSRLWITAASALQGGEEGGPGGGSEEEYGV
ncbi:hypothetical protein [Streptomyces sp. NPDC001315]|uniref:hypothetical protein n=1 Tax=Streptomyces sp. NPDC001315 TaxID=3364562 RepID=UPI0036AB74B2